MEDSKICPVHFSEFVLMIISEHFSLLKFVFLHFALLMLHLMTNHQSRRRVIGSRVYIIRIFDFWDKFNINGGRAAIVLIALLISMQRLGTAEAKCAACEELNED